MVENHRRHLTKTGSSAIELAEALATEPGVTFIRFRNFSNGRRYDFDLASDEGLERRTTRLVKRIQEFIGKGRGHADVYVGCESPSQFLGDIELPASISIWFEAGRWKWEEPKGYKPYGSPEWLADMKASIQANLAAMQTLRAESNPEAKLTTGEQVLKLWREQDSKTPARVELTSYAVVKHQCRHGRRLN